VEPPTWVDLEQMWIIPEAALGPASAGIDPNRRGARNTASTSFLLGEQRADGSGPPDEGQPAKVA
jgi:hypothetical protein